MKTILALVISTCGIASARAITIDTVPVGNPGNPADLRYVNPNFPDGAGSVGYDFRIGKTEITNAQYAAFLNAVAASDPNSLYSDRMETCTQGGILRSGAPGSYTYTVKPPSGTYSYDNKPITFVRFDNAMRFVNWLHNGQPVGAQDSSTTEDGAYTIFYTLKGNGFASFVRNPGARWWIPSTDEWYKAAYYNPDAGNYYDYPTKSNSLPNNNMPSADTGNSANFNTGGFDTTTGSEAYPHTNVGAYTRSSSPYGTFDQGGNATEWTDPSIDASAYAFVRGGSAERESMYLHASWAGRVQQSNHHGLRVATLPIPEPSAMLLVLSVVGAMLGSRYQRPVACGFYRLVELRILPSRLR